MAFQNGEVGRDSSPLVRCLVAVLLALLAMTAGCLEGSLRDPAGGSQSGGAAEDDRLAFNEPVLALPLTCERVGACFEPSVAVDHKGRMFVTDFKGTALARSMDGGKTFERFEAPPVPAGGEPRDAWITADPEGRLWYVALVNGGAQVARSDDGAETWAVNRLVNASTGLPSPFRAASDRPWITFGPDVVYLVHYRVVRLGGMGVYSAAERAIEVSRSDDGGASWSEWRTVVEDPERADDYPPGHPTVDAAGRLLVPYPANRKLEVRVAVSEDGGDTFRHERVGVAPPGDLVRYPFAVADAGTDGTVRVAWALVGGGILTSERSDGGAWAPPVRWNPGERSAGYPWVTHDNREPVVAWFETHNGGTGSTHTLKVARGGDVAAASPPISLPPSTAVWGDARTTEFASVATLPDGRAVAAWTDLESGVWVSIEASSPLG